MDQNIVVSVVTLKCPLPQNWDECYRSSWKMTFNNRNLHVPFNYMILRRRRNQRQIQRYRRYRRRTMNRLYRRHAINILNRASNLTEYFSEVTQQYYGDLKAFLYKPERRKDNS
ncbi:hypothetical protein RCL_jg253.t1 [Rhizophagus clarus]|uniref:Uncharacterized protein n=1 Tax=Rhizophagus clarus TaxID=94130 RepID=A0A8H3LVU3_9GLOM|nr:hypothetical protein RCL_jg253.t1 [Rhizophagus clarus]